MRTILCAGAILCAPFILTGCGAAKAQTAGVGAAGRYTIIHSPHSARYTQLLDTATGRSWTLVQRPDGAGTSFAWEDTPKATAAAAP